MQAVPTQVPAREWMFGNLPDPEREPHQKCHPLRLPELLVKHSCSQDGVSAHDNQQLLQEACRASDHRNVKVEAAQDIPGQSRPPKVM